jgi:hypothetical protein
MRRVYTIWPADRDGLPASSSAAWQQSTSWLVLDVTDGLGAAHVVEGPVSRWDALRRELEIRAVDKSQRKIRRESAR